MANKLQEQEDSEIRFLRVATENFAYWKQKAITLQQAGVNNDLEKRYAEAFKIQLNSFTEDEQLNEI